MKISKGTIIRLVLLILAIANTAMTVTGRNPLPFDEVWVENTVTLVFDAVVMWLAYWKNNSYTQNALNADEVLAKLKEGVLTVEELMKVLKTTQKGE